MDKSFRLRVTLILMLLVSYCVSEVKAQLITMKVGGQDRTYIEYVPKNLGQNRPLLISCHGMNQDAAYQKGMLAIESVCDTAKFMVVFPNGIDKSWDIGGDRDINYIKALIDEMVKKHNIDRNNVYLSGFSMGGMFTYHAMNKIPDLIAAFAPISGYPMGGTTANANVRPIPIIHTHGTGDDVVGFSGVQGALNAWIQHNHCSSTPKVTKNYRGASHATLSVWGNGNDGVEVRLLELKDKGHWISNDNGCHTGREIWLFCKNHGFNKTGPRVSIITPKPNTSYTYFMPSEELVFPTIKVKATASDPNGTVEKVEFYDGKSLIATCEQFPYEIEWIPTSAGKRNLRAIVTDNDGETGEATVEIAINNPNILSLSQNINEAGAVPTGWTTFDGSQKRYGYSNGYTQGCRVLQFTGTRHDFSYGLYFRNATGGVKRGYAKYGLPTTNATMVLSPGRYSLKYRVVNYNRPNFSPITFAIEHTSNAESIAEVTYTPTVNVGNNTENNFNGSILQVFEFDVTEKDEYMVAAYTDKVAMADGVIGQMYLQVKEFGTTDIDTKTMDEVQNTNKTVYDLQGRRVAIKAENATLPKGIYIQNGKKMIVK